MWAANCIPLSDYAASNSVSLFSGQIQATCLQASVVVEYSCRSGTVHKLTEVWLQVAFGQNLAEDISTCQVLHHSVTGQQGLARTGKVQDKLCDLQ